MAKILYVDPDASRVEVIKGLLVQKGHAVTVVNCAERAMLQVERESGYDAVVLHLILPGIDGAELCRWLKQWSSSPGIPRIVFTGPEVRLELDLSEELPRWLPADVYVEGVKEPDELISAVERILCGS